MTCSNSVRRFPTATTTSNDWTRPGRNGRALESAGAAVHPVIRDQARDSGVAANSQPWTETCATRDRSNCREVALIAADARVLGTGWRWILMQYVRRLGGSCESVLLTATIRLSAWIHRGKKVTGGGADAAAGQVGMTSLLVARASMSRFA